MIFRRRTKPSFGERLRETFLPRGGWRRALKYFGKRILRLGGSPHATALGFAAGMFVAWSPLFGLHYVLAATLAFLVRGNVLAAILSTTVGNPLTLPAMWALAYQVGEVMLGEGAGAALSPDMTESLAEKSFDAIWPILKPIFLGSLPLGLATGLISYFVVRWAVRTYQTSRRERLEARRLSRAHAKAV